MQRNMLSYPSLSLAVAAAIGAGCSQPPVLSGLDQPYVWSQESESLPVVPVDQRPVFPGVVAKDLNGDEYTFPQAFEDRVTVASIAWERLDQLKVDTWIADQGDFESALGWSEDNPTAEKVWFVEFPTISRRNAFSRWFIDNGMRSGIREWDARARTITLYTDKEPFRAQIGIPNEDDIAVAVIDRKGRVAKMVYGRMTPGTKKAVLDAVRSVAAEDSRS
ncbi:MAG: hypothetical protein AAGB51_05385 [Planctomycetota bacterium]